MSNAHMPLEFYETVEHFLPPEPSSPSSQGGRPPVSNYTALKVIWFVLVTGIRWRDVPLEMGCCGETARTRLRDWEELGVWEEIHQEMLRRLRQADALEPNIVIIDSAHVRALGGGDLSGPSPVDRAKPGRKYTLIVDRNGVPLGIRISPGNVSDHQEALPIVMLEFPQVGGKVGRPKELPDELYADAGYDSDPLRAVLRWLGIEPYIRRRRSEHGSGLGKVRWVVERALAWVTGLRRMRISYDRLETMLEAWGKFTLGVICYRLWTEAKAVA